MNIHPNIKTKLDYFVKSKKIPHIVFHGPSGSGKRTCLKYLVTHIYGNKDNEKKFVMYINCAHGKGIRFIRDELKFFAKTNIQHKRGKIFKSIILFNADNLTIDAQSALRRCIEQFSHTTRFFIVINEHRKLLKPIISRFCNIFVPLPVINGTPVSLHDYNKQQLNTIIEKYKNKKWLSKAVNNKNNYTDTVNCISFVEKIVNKGFNGLDILDVIEQNKKLSNLKKYKLLIYFDNIRREFRNEKMFILYILTTVFMRPKHRLENIKEL